MRQEHGQLLWGLVLSLFREGEAQVTLVTPAARVTRVTAVVVDQAGLEAAPGLLGLEIPAPDRVETREDAVVPGMLEMLRLR